MNLLIKVYVMVSILLLVVDIVFLMVKSFRNNKYYAKNERLDKWFGEELERYRKSGSFSEGFKKKILKKLCKTRNLIVVQNRLEKEPQYSHLFGDIFFSLIDEYQKKTVFEQAYYIYVISTLDYSKVKFTASYAEKFLTFLDSKSLYTFSNAMTALYKVGQTHLLITAVDKANERQGFYHKRLLVDGLLEANADFEELNEKLLERFDRYGEYVQECLLDYFRMNGCDASSLCMELMQKEDVDRQIQYSAMRYFSKYLNEDAKQFFYELLQNPEEEWIKQMLAIQALFDVTEPQIRTVIKQKITSNNWFVRMNAVEYMHRNGLEKAEIEELLMMRDQYANEALLYQYQDDEEMAEFIREQMRKIEEDMTQDSDNVSLNTIGETEV